MGPQQRREQKPELTNYGEDIKVKSSSSNCERNDQLLDVSNTTKHFSPAWRQTVCATSSILLTLTAGLTSGYSAILLPQLREPGSVIPSDEQSASWIAAAAALPMAPGCLAAGWLMERVGRRRAHLSLCVPFLLGWALIAAAEGLPVMIAGRLLTGFCVGLLGPLGPVYIAECCEPKLRGILLAAVSLAIAVGILAAHLLGTFLSWRLTAGLCCAGPLLAAALLIIVPESPVWLLAHGRTEDAARAFAWLRGHGEKANKELQALVEKQATASSEPALSPREKIAALTSPMLLKPLAIMIVFFMTCQLSGVNAVAFYSVDIVEKSVSGGLDRYAVVIAIDTLRVVMSGVACVLCRRVGRRPLCMVSGACTAACLLALAWLLRDGGSESDAWAPLLCLGGYVTAVSVGLVPLPWVMVGEVFPARVRGLGSGLSSATTFATFFTVVKTAPGLMAGIGVTTTFAMYGAISLVGTAILYFILPETKGRSLQEIEERFKAPEPARTPVTEERNRVTRV